MAKRDGLKEFSNFIEVLEEDYTLLRVTASMVFKAIEKLLHDAKAKEEVKKFQYELKKWDGPANAAKFLYKNFGK